MKNNKGNINANFEDRKNKTIDDSTYGSLEIGNLVRMIEKEIEIDIEEAKRMFSFLDKKANPIEYHYLYGMIMEKDVYSEYDSKMQEKYDNYLNLGIEAIGRGDYSQAYNYFSAGYDVTKNNIFNYYMGKALFKGGDKRTAYPYFDGYTRFGGSKLPKALLYLMSAYLDIGMEKKVRKYYDELAYINEVFDHDFNLVSPFNKNGELKRKNQKNFMSEDDFEDKGKGYKIEDYYEYNFSEKIVIIESLFRNGQYNTALHLLSELKPANKIQRRKVQNLEKNKTLYKNKMSN